MTRDTLIIARNRLTDVCQLGQRPTSTKLLNIFGQEHPQIHTIRSTVVINTLCNMHPISYSMIALFTSIRLSNIKTITHRWLGINKRTAQLQKTKNSLSLKYPTEKYQTSTMSDKLRRSSISKWSH